MNKEKVRDSHQKKGGIRMMIVADGLLQSIWKDQSSFIWNTFLKGIFVSGTFIMWGITAILFVLLLIHMGWYTVDLSPEKAVASIKTSFWISSWVVYLVLYIPVAYANMNPDDSLFFTILSGFFGYFVIFFPVWAIKFIVNKIPLVNLIGPFLLMFLTFPYLAALKLHGNRGYDKEEESSTGSGVHYHT